MKKLLGILVLGLLSSFSVFAEDILGCSSIDFPRHAKMYRNFDKILNNLQKERAKAFKEFHNEVAMGKFPAKKHSISVDKTQLSLYKKFLKKKIKN